MSDHTTPAGPERVGLSEREIAEWVVETCLTFGATTYTAYKVAGLFVEGLSDDRSAA